MAAGVAKHELAAAALVEQGAAHRQRLADPRTLEGEPPLELGQLGIAKPGGHALSMQVQLDCVKIQRVTPPRCRSTSRSRRRRPVPKVPRWDFLRNFAKRRRTRELRW